MFTLTFAALLSMGLGRNGDAKSLLRGPDDFMRMVQVIDWIDGQGWRDTVQRRLDPPEGVPMHWSRLPDIPLAAIVVLAEPWLGRAKAVYLSALLVPPLYGGLFIGFYIWAARPLTGGGRALVPVLMIGTLIIPLQQMLPGRVDHHGLQLVLTVLTLGFLIRALNPAGFRAAAGLGIIGGVSLAIGLEALPILGAATVVLGLAWVSRRGAAAVLATFGATLTATAVILILLTLRITVWTATVCDRMSVVHVALTAIVLAAGAGALALERLRPAAGWLPRLATLGGIGIAGLALVAAAFPQCAGSPYAHLSAEARYWFDAVSEAQSLFGYYHRKPGAAVAFAILPLAALVSVTWQWVRSGDAREPRWIALSVLVLSGTALVFWQIRGVTYAALVAGLALIPLAAAVNDRADRTKRILARVGLRLCVPMICVFAVVSPYQFLQPAASRAAAKQQPPCKVATALAALNDPAGLGAAARTIAAPVDVGPQILLLTRHKVLAAPYHRDIRGLADNRRIFAGSAQQSLATVEARGVGAILYCRKHAAISAYAGIPAFLNDHLDAERPPPWLVPVLQKNGYGLYRVRPAPGNIP